MLTEQTKRGIKFWATVILMGIIFILLVQSIGGLSVLIDGIVESWPLGILGVALLYTLVMLIRVVRWNLLLRSSNIEVEFSLLARVAWIAWAQNAVLPARLGEVSRLYILKDREDVPVSVTTASILLEKFFDLFGLLFVLATSALLFSIDNTELQSSFVQNIQLLGVLVLIGSLSILSTVVFDEFYLRLLNFMPLKSKLIPLFKRFQRSAKTLLKNRFMFLQVMLISILQWFIEALTIVTIAWVLGVRISVIGIIFAAIVGYATYIFPITPGSLGPFELFVGQLLVIIGNITTDQATKVPFVTHILVIVYLGLTSLIATTTLSYREKNLES